MADSITITVNAVARTLTKINNDAYANEYYLRVDGRDYRLRTKHSRDKVASGATPRDRHVITFTETIYPTATTPELVRQSQVTIVGSAYDAVADQSKVQLGLQAFLTDANIQALIGYQL